MNDELIAKKFLESNGFYNFNVIKKFSNGMSNHTFLIKKNKEKFVLRLPFENANRYLKRKNEALILEKIENFNLTNKTIYYNKKTGTKLSTYIEGENLKDISYVDEKDFIKLINVIKTLNNIKIKHIEKENILKKIKKLEKENITFDDEYKKIRKQLFIYYKKYLKNDKKVLIHNDLQLNNIIKNNDDIYLLDFEFSLKASIYHEIASLKNSLFFDERYKKIDVCKIYFEKPKDIDYLKTTISQAVLIARWYLVAKIKHLEIKQSPINFQDVAQKFYNYLKELFKQIGDYDKKRSSFA